MSSYKIAVVEDDELLADMYKLSMEAAGFECAVALNGIEGLELAHSFMPDILLLDLMLPGLPGDKVLAKIRATDWGKDMKVMVMTNISKDEAPDSLKDLGIIQYIVKAQHTPKEIIAIIQEILN